MIGPKPQKPSAMTEPHEERRMRRELFRRIELLFAIADAKGYAPSTPPLLPRPRRVGRSR